MGDAQANIDKDSSEIRTAIGLAVVGNKHAYGAVKFAYPISERPNLQLSSKCDLEEAILYLRIGKVRSLGATTVADFWGLCPRLTQGASYRYQRKESGGQHTEVAAPAMPSGTNPYGVLLHARYNRVGVAHCWVLLGRF